MSVNTVIYCSTAVFLIVSNCKIVYPLKSDTEESSSYTTYDYINDSLVVVNTNSTCHTEANHSSGKTTDGAQIAPPSSLSEVTTVVSSHLNTSPERLADDVSPEGLADDVSFGNTSLAVTYEKIQPPNQGNNAKNQESSSNTTFGYRNVSLVVGNVDSTWHTETSFSNGEITDEAKTVSYISEVVTWVSSQLNTSLDGLEDVALFGNTSVAPASENTQLLDGGKNVRKQGSCATCSSTTTTTITTTTTTISEVVTEVSSQSNMTLMEVVHAMSFGNTNVSAASEGTKLLYQGENVENQGSSSSTTIGYNNASLLVADTDATWHTQSSNSTAKTRDKPEIILPTTISEVVTGVYSKSNMTLEGIPDVSFGNKSVDTIYEGTELPNPGVNAKDPLKPSIVVVIIICIIITIAGPIIIYLRKRRREAVTMIIR